MMRNAKQNGKAAFAWQGINQLRVFPDNPIRLPGSIPEPGTQPHRDRDNRLPANLLGDVDCHGNEAKPSPN
jgi:hypothetical protein